MPASDSNRVAILYGLESTYKVPPSAGTFLRLTGESLRSDTQTVASQEIRSDRQVPDLIRTGLSVSGDLNFEFSGSSYDEFLKSVLMSTAWSSQVSVSGLTLTVVAAAGTITRSAGSWITDGIVINQWVQFGGFANAGNNSFFKVLSVTATVITVVQNAPTTRLVNETSGIGAGTAKMGGQILNGTTLTSYTFERRYTDQASEFAAFVGCLLDKWNLNVTKDGIITGSFGILGAKELPSYGTTLFSTTTPATTTDVMNAIDDVKLFAENNDPYDITDFTIAFGNNLRNRLQIGTLGAISIGTGTVDVQGTHKAYFSSRTVMDRYINFTSSALAFVVQKGSLSYVIDFPRIKYRSGQRVAGGINTDIIADMAWTAIRDPNEGITIRIARFM